MVIKTTQIDLGLDWYSKWPRDVTCAAKRVDDLVFIGGQLPLDSDDSIIGVGNVQEQARFALTKFKDCVEQAGGSIDDVCDVQSFHTDVRHIPAVLEVAKEFFKKSKPTWCAVGTTGLYKMGIDVCFSGLAVLNAKTKDINPGLEWYAKPPWDVAVPCKVANDLVIMGQMCGMDEKGRVVAPGNYPAQSRFAWKKTIECIEEAGGTSENIIDVIWYFRDRRGGLWPPVITAEVLIKDKSVRAKSSERVAGTAISMPGFFHPDILGLQHVYAVLGEKEQIPLGGWINYVTPGHYPGDIMWGAIKVGRYVFISGQVMFDEFFFEPTLEIDIPSIKKQARHAFSDHVRILGTLGATLDNLVFIRSYSDPGYIDPILEVAHEFFHNGKAAWNPVGNSGLFQRQMLVEIYGIAIVEEDHFRHYFD